MGGQERPPHPYPLPGGEGEMVAAGAWLGAVGLLPCDPHT